MSNNYLFDKTYLPLKLMNNKRLFVNKKRLEVLKEELEDFLNNNRYMINKKFSEQILFSQEIKTNNEIEGYNDDVKIINEIIKDEKNKEITSLERRRRIVNLYRGYKYILGTPNITKDNLKKLYKILSKGLLAKEEEQRMGNYYRLDPVYIYHSLNIIAKPDEGIKSELIDEYMNRLLNYLNENTGEKTHTDYYIKSQIAHFYFIYIHPYYDVNGRTARTTSMWYLLNNKAYPYLIFNRAIVLDKNKYYRVIRDVIKFHNMTYFLNYMLENVKVELEKEHIINSIESSINYSLTILERQTLHYILTMKSLKTVCDFTVYYNRHNDKKKVREVYQEMIEPLLDKNVIIKDRDTKKNMFDDTKNFVYKINEKYVDNNPVLIKRLKLQIN